MNALHNVRGKAPFGTNGNHVGARAATARVGRVILAVGLCAAFAAPAASLCGCGRGDSTSSSAASAQKETSSRLDGISLKCSVRPPTKGFDRAYYVRLSYEFKNTGDTTIDDWAGTLSVKQGDNELYPQSNDVPDDSSDLLAQRRVRSGRSGTRVHYYSLYNHSEPVTVTFLDPNGATVRSSMLELPRNWRKYKVK